ncbi:hypothetical protein NE237_022844 [Protea cynaroides]|uniref:Uncharacterized protein n=1 Tax=Protea cynaroides TaxID=273540 RepID=A0A9Q0HDX8_9MAGN|nr:hypothetical protein NE237_022844 [Protea cynaroides]
MAITLAEMFARELLGFDADNKLLRINYLHRVDAEPAAHWANAAATWTPSFLLLPAFSRAELEFFIRKGRQNSKNKKSKTVVVVLPKKGTSEGSKDESSLSKNSKAAKVGQAVRWEKVLLEGVERLANRGKYRSWGTGRERRLVEMAVARDWGLVGLATARRMGSTSLDCRTIAS